MDVYVKDLPASIKIYFYMCNSRDLQSRSIKDLKVSITTKNGVHIISRIWLDIKSRSIYKILIPLCKLLLDVKKDKDFNKMKSIYSKENMNLVEKHWKNSANIYFTKEEIKAMKQNKLQYETKLEKYFPSGRLEY